METVAEQIAIYAAAGASIGAIAGLTWGLWAARRVLARARLLKRQAETQCERMRERWLDEAAFTKALRRSHANEVSALVRIVRKYEP